MTRITNPLQFNYIPYPLWRRTMAGWLRPLLNPIFERVYPVAEDQHPPQTIAEMASYLTRYDLVTDNVHNLLENSRAQIECAPKVGRSKTLSGRYRRQTTRCAYPRAMGTTGVGAGQFADSISAVNGIYMRR